jgi:hypothetical protein
MKRIFIISYLITGMLIQVKAQYNEKLWYKQPANVWTEALPIGNGRLGAMVFGKVNEELIQLNESTLWSGGTNPSPYQSRCAEIFNAGEGSIATGRLRESHIAEQKNAGSLY